jgi:hypothetical protein
VAWTLSGYYRINPRTDPFPIGDLASDGQKLV